MQPTTSMYTQYNIASLLCTMYLHQLAAYRICHKQSTFDRRQ